MSDDGDCCYPVEGYVKCDKVEHWDEPEPCQLCKDNLLTRDQIRASLEAIAWPCRMGVLYQSILAHDGSQRHTIKQQAQEIRQLKQTIDSIHSAIHGKA